jgi:ribosomal protein S26
MPFKNRRFAKQIKNKPCEWCGWQVASRHAAHIIDEVKVAKEWNAMSFCPNCATVFDDIIRPKLYKALKEYGAKNLPKSWEKSNKITSFKFKNT